MGIIDAFVYAHNYHRRNTDNPGNFGDSMEGRIRLLTAIPPTYAHGYQSLCLDARSTFLVKGFACRLSEPDDRVSRTLEPQRVKKATMFKGWAACTDGGTRVSEGETTAGWGAVALSPDGRLYIMFRPVIATEAHLCVCRCQAPLQQHC